jgi:hypothetical protein
MSMDVLRQLEAEGYFAKAAGGDHRACGLFARLAAFRLNPNGDADGWGCLRKTGGGKNVEGYAEDAIVLGSDPRNVRNVVDIIVGAGQSNASIGWGGWEPGKDRRESDIWERPAPLTAEQMNYLKAGSSGGGTGGGTGGGGGTQTPTACKFAPTETNVILDRIGGLQTDVIAFGSATTQALDEVRQVKAELLNLIARLEQGFAIDANSRYFGAIKGTVKLPKP